MKKLIILITILGCITVGCKNKKGNTQSEVEVNQEWNLTDYDSIPQSKVLEMSKRYLDSAKLNPDGVITRYIVMDGDLLKKIIDKKKRVKLISVIDSRKNITAILQLLEDGKYLYYDIKVFNKQALTYENDVCPPPTPCNILE